MGEPPTFVADVMLGKLAKWLRLLGYDTLYFRESNDGDLARLARAEGRVLLTRDRELAKRRALRALWIENERLEWQLREVFDRLGLTTNGAFSRCPECNELLTPREPGQVQSKVPPYVFKTQTRFAECPRCGRVFWRGTHWAHMVATLRTARGGSA